MRTEDGIGRAYWDDLAAGIPMEGDTTDTSCKREPVEMSEEAKRLVAEAVTVFVKHIGVDRLEAMSAQQQSDIIAAIMEAVDVASVNRLVEILNSTEDAEAR